MDEVYLEVVHPDRSRLYGTGSAGRSQASRGSTSSTGTSRSTQRMYETELSEVRGQLAEEQAAREALAQEIAEEQARRASLEERFAMFEQFMRQQGP